MLLGLFREEYETKGIGIDKLMDEGKLDRMKNGPVYWVDTSDRNPCIGNIDNLSKTQKKSCLAVTGQIVVGKCFAGLNFLHIAKIN